MKKVLISAGFLCGAVACSPLEEVGRAPDFTNSVTGPEYNAMMSPGFPATVDRSRKDVASLWSREQQSLLGDRRALKRGDILTVVIEIDEKAEISNSTERSRDGQKSMGIPSFFGLPQRANELLPVGANMANAVETNSSTSHQGDGQVKRKEKITLRVAATVVDVLQNGVLAIQGSQEVRVNFEIRELLVSGYVRPGDITRQNQITYDKIASARISYGGRGQITTVQQPAYGQQIADIVLPF
ncbi:flagellar basal body L-ring protein FlgH [Halocynthiibacter sp. C4]|uniref:flagellar basal body L-ring protein FlgH n=1 Tax=Halocynthiibacter sp. C4 TaxID=2992758 RepID=UPI00237C5083|nr:flagellar basal body L-ring protein FlgH [Halocynthiibacter sp. C4]MDE0591352.1 flagellar basal body L-ring protein FlgH [Halocynthiibacter sp. C4]